MLGLMMADGVVAQTPHSGRFFGLWGFAAGGLLEGRAAMSVTRLLLSGLLVASGLILAAFTLHGAFDPHWPMHASGATGPALKPWSTNTVIKPDAAPQAAPAQDAKATADARAAALARKKKLAEKRRAEKQLAEQKAKEQPQQAALQWPWNWLGN
jgi:hypothetical protein